MWGSGVERLERRTLLSAHLVSDIRPDNLPSSPVSAPTTAAAVGGTLYFSADDGVHGRELWKSDGTAGGTVLVADLRPGPGGSSPRAMTDFNGTLYFAADDGAHGMELWRSDGTAAGTVMVKDIRPGGDGSAPAPDDGNLSPTRLVLGNALYFSADDGIHGPELWKTDGTEAGTVLVKDALPGQYGSSPAWLTALGGKIVYTARTPDVGEELWISDGTADGTYLLKDLKPGRPDSQPVLLTHSGGAVYFRLDGGGAFGALYRTDGTPEGTLQVAQLGDTVSSLTDLNGTLYFVAGDRLYRTDGTPAGTTRAPFDLTYSAAAAGLVGIGGALYFGGVDGEHGRELWRSDGTAEGTRMVRDLRPGPDGSNPRGLMNVGGTLYFVADDDTGMQFYKSDGTAAGTVRLTQVPGGVAGPQPSWSIFPVPSGGRLYFSRNSPDIGAELWVTDDSAAGASLLNDINRVGADSNPTSGAELNGFYYFTTDDHWLWRTDGTAAGTSRVKFIGTDNSGRGPREFVDSGGAIYFTGGGRPASPFGISPVLWQSDGTAAGTVPQVSPEYGDGVLGLTPFGGALYYAARDARGAYQLWRTDGTPGGSGPATAFGPQEVTSLNMLTPAGGTLYFVAVRAGAGSELFATDGTAAGTRVVKFLDARPFDSDPPGLAEVNGTVYFTAPDGAYGTALYKTDGTAAGTVLVRDFPAYQPPPNPSGVIGQAVTPRLAELTTANGLLFFTVAGAADRALWRSDGTPQGTFPVKDVNPDPADASPAGLTAVGSALYFAAADPARGRELWKTDGTPDGTVLVKDLNAGPASSGALPVHATGRDLYFTADDGAHGTELWVTDGTDAGTALVQDINPGPGGSNPSNFGTANGALFFRAFDRDHGAELWTTPLRRPAPRAEAGGPYPTVEGQPAVLSSFGSTGDIVKYEWDFDYDGVTFTADATGPSAEFPAADGPSVHTVALRVTAADGDTRTDTAQVDVANVAPTLHLSGLSAATENAPYVLNLSSSDPGADTIDHWTVEWGDGTTETVAGNPPSVSHVYADGPAFASIRATATDDDGTYDATTAGVTVGGVDATFGNGGRVVGPQPGQRDMVVLPDGKVLVGGFTRDLYEIQGFMARYNPDGSPDTGFGAGGRVNTPILPGHLAVQPDGKILVGAVRALDNRAYLARFNADGTLDAGFGKGGLVDGDEFALVTANAFAFQPDGKIVVGGLMEYSSPAPRQPSGQFFVRRYGPDGVIDRDFGTAGTVILSLPASSAAATSLHLLPDGRILAAGTTGDERPTSAIVLTRLSAGGAMDETFGDHGTIVTSVAADTFATTFAYGADGAIVAVGYTTGYPIPLSPAGRRLLVVRYNADGSLDPTFGRGGMVRDESPPSPAGTYSYATAAAVQADGRVVVAGKADGSGVVYRYDASGRQDDAFGDAGRSDLGFDPDDRSQVALGLQPDGRIVAARTTAARDFDVGPPGAVLTRLVASGITVRVANAAPAVQAGPDAALLAGQSLERAGSFSDGNDAWTATVDYGDGGGPQPLALAADKSFRLSHAYARPGDYPVTVSVADDDGATGTASFRVGVATLPVPPVPPPAELRLPAAADAYARDGAFATTNFGRSPELVVKNANAAGYRRESYLRFDLSSLALPAAGVGSVKLRLFGRLSETAHGGVPVGLYAASDTSWAESGLTWRKRPASAATPLTTQTISGTAGRWYEFDVTRYVKQRRAAGAKAVSFALKGLAPFGGAVVTFASDEASFNRPALLVRPTATAASPTHEV